jgi:hypothetical protein
MNEFQGAFRSVIAAGNAVEARQPEVAAQMERLYHAVENVERAARELTSRLTSVQQPAGNGCGPVRGQAPVPVLCPHAAGIRAQVEQLNALADLLDANARLLEI